MTTTTNSFSNFDESYIPPKFSERQMNDAKRYAREYDKESKEFKAFWKAPYVVRKVGTGTDEVKFQVVRVNELKQLLRKNKDLKGMIDKVPFQEILALISARIYTATVLGEVSIKDNTLDARSIFLKEYREDAIEALKMFGEEHEMTFKVKRCTKEYSEEFKEFKAFWEAPYVVWEVGTGTDEVKFQVIRINELKQLLRKDKNLKGVIDKVPFQEILALISARTYTATVLGEVSIKDMTIDATAISLEYREDAIEALKMLGEEYGMTFKVENLD